MGLSPLHLRIQADGERVEPAEAIYRPSYITSNAISSDTGLQITEDKFITSDDVLISSVNLRNPGEYAIAVQVDHVFGIAAGEQAFGQSEPVWVYREGPPGDDLRFHLHASGMRTLVFAVGFGTSEEQARRRVWRWRNDLNPVSLQRDEYQGWFDAYVPGFDCSDPWFLKLWYHRWFAVRRNYWDEDRPEQEVWGGNPQIATMPVEGDQAEMQESGSQWEWERLCRGQFENNDYDRPYLNPIPTFDFEYPHSDFFRERGCLWAERFLREILGIVPRTDNMLEICPQVPSGAWSHFCLENLSYRGRRLTIVWDDPSEKEDAYDDGDKGFTVYVDGHRQFHQSTLGPALIALNGNTRDEWQGNLA
jgi:hypothetical protein